MSVRVWKIDRAAVRQRLEAWARRLLEAPEVVAVVLFGSHARGEATAASDADVLILLRDSDLDFSDRLTHFKPQGLGLGVDVFPYTLDEARRSAAEGWGTVPPALAEGMLLAGDPEWRELLNLDA